MPAITPAEWGPGLVVRHAISQGYVRHITDELFPNLASNVWLTIDAMSMTIDVDEPSTVLQLFRAAAYDGEQFHARLRHGSQTTVYQTHETAYSPGRVDGNSITLFRPWDVARGTRTFDVQVRYPYPVTQLRWPYLRDLRMSLAVLKR